MPVIRKNPPPSPDESRLRSDLLAEMRRNSPNGYAWRADGGGADFAGEQECPCHRAVGRVGWIAAAQARRNRARCVFGAYEDAFGTAEMLKVTLALGITSQEASRMNLKVG